MGALLNVWLDVISFEISRHVFQNWHDQYSGQYSRSSLRHDREYLSFRRNGKCIFCIQFIRPKYFASRGAPVRSESCSCKLLLVKCEVNKINTKFYVNRKHWPSLLGSLSPIQYKFLHTMFMFYLMSWHLQPSLWFLLPAPPLIRL